MLFRSKKKAKEELDKKVASGEVQVQETLSLLTKSKKFDHEIQDESSSVSLELDIEASIAIFKKDDLLNMAIEILNPEIATSAGMEVEKEKSTVFVTGVVKNSSGENEILNGEAKIVLRQVIASEEVIKKVSGASFESAKKIILDFEGVKSIEIKIMPGMFTILSRLPLKSGSISLIIKTL